MPQSVCLRAISKKPSHGLGKPARSLGMVCPIDMLSTPAGVEAVLDLVGQIEHGVVI